MTAQNGDALNRLRQASEAAIMGPEQPRGNRAPGPPVLGEAPHDARIRPFFEAEEIGGRSLQSKVAGRPRIGPAKAGEDIDVGRPWSDSGKRHEHRDDLIVGMAIERINPEFASMGGPRQSVAGAA